MKKDTKWAKRLGSEIRSMRIKADISQESLAHQAGLHPTYISMVENGKKHITVQALMSITHACGLSMEDFFHRLK